jgi:hypothetical protein
MDMNEIEIQQVVADLDRLFSDDNNVCGVKPFEQMYASVRNDAMKNKTGSDLHKLKCMKINISSVVRSCNVDHTGKSRSNLDDD